jgi:hypothetical protein
MKTRVVWLGLVLGLFVVGNILGDTKAPWKEFTSREGGFSAQMPTKPLELKKTMKSPLGPVEFYMFQATAPREGIAYTVAYNDFPEAFPQLVKAGDILELSTESFAQGVNGKLVSSKETKLGDYPGREYEVEVFGGKAVLRGRIFLVDQRLYQVMAIARADAADSPSIGRFLDSFRLTKDD